MSQGMHGAEQPKCDRCNNLLTTFGEEIKKWAKGNNGGPFPENMKQLFYSHIQWKPIPPPLNQTLSHQKQLVLLDTKWVLNYLLHKNSLIRGLL